MKITINNYLWLLLAFMTYSGFSYTMQAELEKTDYQQMLFQANSADNVRFALARGADVNAVDANGRTPLHRASREAKNVVVKVLIDAGADVDARDVCGWTALHEAAIEGYAHVVELLLAAGADVDARDGAGWTPLHMAADGDHTKVVELLLTAGADVDAKNAHGLTALHRAEELSVVMLLTGAGADYSDLKESPVIQQALAELQTE